MTHDWFDDAEMLVALDDHLARDTTPFTVPGHKGRGGDLHPALGFLLGADVPLYGGIDTVRLERGLLAAAEEKAARLWGADWCRFSVGGSSHANEALTLALGQPGDTVLVTRTAHRSTLLGLVLAGLRPVWLENVVDGRYGIPAGLSVPALRRALDEHPEAVAVLCVEPSYLGTMADVREIVRAAHERDVPVVVDQAWGAHLGFAPGFPEHAIAAGADAMVISAHKTLPSFTQASLILARTDRLDPGRLERGFDVAHTTSPSGAILASIDAARALLADPTGRDLLLALAERVERLRARLRPAGLVLPGPADFDGRFDPAKIVILTAPSGRSGLDLERELTASGIALEMADRDTLVPIATILDDDAALDRLGDAILAAMDRVPGRPRPIRLAAQWGSFSPQITTPREAFFADREAVPFDQAAGRTSAEVIAPYPPGVPVLVPGEEVTEDALTRLRQAAAAGLVIRYAADPTLATIQVLR
jgi:lysine decarboxylase